jgi:hypothetical protein
LVPPSKESVHTRTVAAPPVSAKPILTMSVLNSSWPEKL